MLQSDLCNYSNAYIIIKKTITFDGAANINKYNRKLIFKNNAPFTNCISKINVNWQCRGPRCSNANE